jgi:hypothetical protein
VIKSNDLEDYLVNNFNYIFFPIAYETKLKIKSDNAKIIKCIGDQNTILDELDKNPVIENKIEFDLGTAFSSQLILEKNRAFSKGGLILLKISPDDLAKNEDIKFDFSLEYISDDDNFKSLQNYTYTIKREEKNQTEFYKDNNIKKGIAIYYFVNALNYLVQSEKEKKKNNNQGSKAQNKARDMKMLETRQTIKNLLENNFGEIDTDENKKILNNYLRLLNKRYEGFKVMVIKFYNLEAAPLAF